MTAGHTASVPAPLDNAAVAERLEAFAGLLDLAGASPYTARAYRRAAETIRETRAPILELARQGRAQELRGIGPGIAARLRELAETGTIAELDELRSVVRPELVGLGRMRGIAPNRMVAIATVLGLETPGDFRRAAHEGALRTVPGVGPAAIQGGSFAGKTIVRELNRLPRKKFHYRNKGDLATIGRSRAIADFGWVRFGGRLAWFLWLFVHIMYLVGFRNRLVVLFEWGYAYFTNQAGVRLITDVERYKPPV